MSTMCAEKHSFYPSQQLHLLSPKKPTFKDTIFDSNIANLIPPRMLLSRKTQIQETPEISLYESNLRKYLPYNDDNEEIEELDSSDSADPYSSDQFRMFEFKVRRCTRSRSHDWTDCPFAHPGEKARRRDPRRYHYSGTVCPDFRRGGCTRGENCQYAHGVFECWLHPSRYRTEACKDGKNCKRKICFFAHSPKQLRISPEISNTERKFKSLNHNLNHRCLFCSHNSVSNSPTSTLLGMPHLSPPMSPSPPLSPVKHIGINGFSPLSRFGGCESCNLSKLSTGVVSYKEMLTELMNSMEAMKFSESVSSPCSSTTPNNNNRNVNVPWLDVSFNVEDHQQQHFTLSPSTPSPSGSGNLFREDYSSKITVTAADLDKMNDNSTEFGGPADPDLGWVNELLM
ncbi:zinc finger family protein [Tripterygium wilfordii]|uniref:Zinc finger family protein n=1 Tax=Tripterygium wilfordii TaxID=458696 RepID=A0A7J7CEK9_TRIWF|nr:zinc finger CCCH domain-containing protein 2-like [Tripterygium wilfordii]KAF5732578.1 zinc finger family protein [Tripterygium wilfordii]